MPSTRQLTIKNKYTDTNLDEFDMTYTVEKDGEVVEHGVVNLPSCAPGESVTIDIPELEVAGMGSDKAEYFVNFDVRLKKLLYGLLPDIRWQWHSSSSTTICLRLHLSIPLPA